MSLSSLFRVNAASSATVCGLQRQQRDVNEGASEQQQVWSLLDSSRWLVSTAGNNQLDSGFKQLSNHNAGARARRLAE